MTAAATGEPDRQGARDGGVRAGLLRVFSAQVYGQGITIAVQLGLVPVLLALWGVRTYGTWLLVAAVPTYLAFSDLGFTYVAKNVMVSQVAAGNRQAALRTFQSVFALLNAVAPLVLLVAVALVATLDVTAAIGIPAADRPSAGIALVALIAAVLVYQYFLLVCAGVRSQNRAAAESVLAATIRLVEALAVAAAAGAGGGIVAAAVATLVTRTVYTVCVYAWLRGAAPWLAFGHAHACRAEIRRLLHPAIGFAVIPIAQALLIQGPLIVAGALMGPAAVVTLATTRTLTRMGTSATNVLNNTFVTEYAMRFGRRDLTGFRLLFRRHLKIGTATIACYGAGVLLLGTLAIALITHGKVRPEFVFLALMVAGVACEMLYTTMLTPLAAANHHAAAGHWLLAVAVAGVLCCYPAVAADGLRGAAAALLLAQAAALTAFAVLLRRALRRWKPGVPPPIIIFRLGSLGDTVVALPCFHAIERAFPDRKRLALTNVPVSSKAAALEAILSPGGFIHGAIAYPIGLRGIAGLWRLWRTLRATGADTLIYLSPVRPAVAVRRDRLFFHLCGIRRIIGSPLTQDLRVNRVDPVTGEVEPEAERLARTIAALGQIDLADRELWNLRLTPAEQAVAAAAIAPLAGKRFLAINLGGKAAEKDWGDANWTILVERLATEIDAAGLIAVGGADDAERSAAVLARWPGQTVNLCGRLAPRETAAVLAHARLLIGHDSGPLHLAAAGDTPTVGLFGGYNRPRQWHPYGGGHRPIHTMGGMAAITIPEVLAEIRDVLAAGS